MFTMDAIEYNRCIFGIILNIIDDNIHSLHFTLQSLVEVNRLQYYGVGALGK